MSTAPIDDASPVPSPCIKVCVLDALSVCVGCGRQIEEISAWSTLTEEQQRSICERAAQRLEGMRRLMASAD